MGVLISNDLSWNSHVKLIVSNAKKRMGLVHHTLGYNVNHKVKLKCYTGLVRPVLEYATVLWCPHNKNLILQIESVQRQASKKKVNDYSLDYRDRLLACSVLPLTLRREYLDLIFIFNS